ncbi:MAG: hypothetical protein ACR2I0_14080, partial [Rhodoferax sp.]
LDKFGFMGRHYPRATDKLGAQSNQTIFGLMLCWRRRVSNPSFPAQPPVYLDVAQALANVGDAEVLQDMLVLLRDQLASELPQVADLLLKGDLPGVQKLLHSLKGCLPIFCTQIVCDEVLQVECLCKSSDAAGARAAFAVLRPKLEDLHTELLLHLAGSAA